MDRRKAPTRAGCWTVRSKVRWKEPRRAIDGIRPALARCNSAHSAPGGCNSQAGQTAAGPKRPVRPNERPARLEPPVPSEQTVFGKRRLALRASGHSWARGRRPGRHRTPEISPSVRSRPSRGMHCPAPACCNPRMAAGFPWNRRPRPGASRGLGRRTSRPAQARRPWRRAAARLQAHQHRRLTA